MMGSCSTHDDFGELGFHLCQKCLAEDFCQEFRGFYLGCETSVKALENVSRAGGHRGRRTECSYSGWVGCA